MAHSLTTDQILGMAAGPELDALVAERVMGWKRGQRGNWIVLVPPNHEWLSDDGGWQPTTKEVTFPLEDLHIPAYSTDIAAAWEVVTYLRETLHFQIKTEDEWWMARFAFVDPTDFEDMSCWSNADTAPLAICRAALVSTSQR